MGWGQEPVMQYKKKGGKMMTRGKVWIAAMLGGLLIASLGSFSCTREEKDLSVATLSIDGYGLVIDSQGKWVGDPVNLQGAPGPEGEPGQAGPQGIPGLQGEVGPPGPNMIVAMGVIGHAGGITQGYNIAEVTYNSNYFEYRITLAGIDYNRMGYVTMVTPFTAALDFDVSSDAGQLVITFSAPQAFSFMVCQVP